MTNPKNHLLVKVGEAAIRARMTEAECRADPLKAMRISMDAMRATLGFDKPADEPEPPVS